MVKTSSALVQWMILQNKARTWARSWKKIEFGTRYEAAQHDYAGLAFSEAKEQQLLDESESGKHPAPAYSPIPTVERSPSTTAPSPSLSAIPNNAPSFQPSDAPYVAPSNQPRTQRTPEYAFLRCAVNEPVPLGPFLSRS